MPDKPLSKLGQFYGEPLGVSSEDFLNLEKDIVRQRSEIMQRTTQLEKERADFQNYIGDREKQINQEAENLRREFLDRQRTLEHEFEEKEAARKAEEDRLRTNFSAMRADASQRLREAREKLEEVAAQRKVLEVEKLQYDDENNRRLQLKSVEFVDSVVHDLKKRETDFSNISFWWSVGGAVALVIAAIPAAITIIVGAIWPDAEMSWPSLILYTTKSALFVAVAGIIARYAFLLSKRYLEESLGVSNTIHGVSFGQLYVQSYGATAGWDQVKEAFSNWHQRSESRLISASDKDSENLKPEAESGLKYVTDLVDAISKLKNAP